MTDGQRRGVVDDHLDQASALMAKVERFLVRREELPWWRVLTRRSLRAKAHALWGQVEVHIEKAHRLREIEERLAAFQYEPPPPPRPEERLWRAVGLLWPPVQHRNPYNDEWQNCAWEHPAHHRELQHRPHPDAPQEGR